MIKIKNSLFEDIEEESDINFRDLITSLSESGTFEELYDEIGNEIFWDNNLPSLIDNPDFFEDDFPVGTTSADELLESYSFSDEDIAKSSYIRKKVLEQVGPFYEDDLLDWNDIEKENSSLGRDISTSFYEGLWTGDVYEFFDSYEGYDDSEALDKVVSEGSEENHKSIRRIPIWKDSTLPIQNLMGEDNVKEDSEAREQYEQFVLICRWAAGDGLAYGSANEAIDSFERSLADACPTGVTISNSGRADYRKLTVNLEEYLSKCPAEQLVSDIIYWSNNYYILDAFRKVILEKIADNFSFYEPRYGWWGFDKDAFNDSLSDRLYDEFDV